MTKSRKQFWNFFDSLEGDKVVWIIALMLIMISIVCLFSSTSRLLTGNLTRLDIVKGQALMACLGLAVIIICYNVKDIKAFRWCSQWGFALSLALLLLLVSQIDTPFIKSVEINGARRILQVSGFQIHVYEVVKVAMVLYMAWAIDAIRNGSLKWPAGKKLQKYIYLYAPFVTIILMVIPGSNSAALFIGFIMFTVILLGGGNFKDMALLALVAVAIVSCCVGIYTISDGKYMQRIGTAVSRITEDTDWEQIVRDSKKGSKEFFEALDEIRQPYSARIAVHEGGLIGKGPGQSTQRYVVPDMSEDYMFSFIIEEYGLFGGIVIIFLYVSLLARGALIVRNCGSDLYAKLTVGGLCLLISGQAFLHMFVNADIGPMTGQTLPIISHGNSAFLCFCLAFGIILSISRMANKRMEIIQKDARPLAEDHDVVKDLDILEEI